ncbi:RNA pseudouridine synthase [Lederbergia sp. NSJ-179]|uniref:RluA family pseudouridine synthase n=1 Tax=Lederbergia sp. NSJ-179 TaxID=2931402 RepID=UPI001FD04ADB|nr:RNA pseudouridine synthase [Lederbergia sp. NSJ-179]MCJ7840039.1 RNA pseudouridine synthase [Lederbergia sp. NSJ-179]
MDIPILYEDNHLLAVEKPVNIPVQADQTGDLDLLSILKEDIKVRYQKPGNVYLGLVHRLDRPVGGVMVLAKTSKAASRLSEVIRRQAFNKKYLAVVRGTPKEKQAKLEHTLWKDRQKNQVYVVPADHPQGKKAVLEYKVVGEEKDMSLLQIRLHTGRPHQIRVQLSHIGCPLHGDQKYGQKINKPGQQIALWAAELQFEHPTKKDWIKVTQAPPKTFPWKLFE